MIPFRHTDERIWNAARRLRDGRVDDRKYVAVMDRDTYVDWVVSTRTWLRSADPDGVILGFPITIDPHLRRGEVALRHEVEA